jgi:hypothetical protein
MTHRPIRPDDLPAGFVLGETLRLAPVDGPQSELTLADAERGRLVTLTSVTTVTRLRDLFRRAFPQPEQNMARGVAKFLQTNCELDAGLTQQTRDRDTCELVVVDHYDAGQVIVQRGEIIDAKTQGALGQLNEKLTATRLNSQLAVQREQIQQEQTQAQREQARAEAEHATALKTRDQQLNLQSQNLAARTRNEWLLAALAGISVVALAAFWLLARSRRREPSLQSAHGERLQRVLARNRRSEPSLLPERAEKLPLPPQDFFQASLNPQVAQILKEAVVQGLAAQRSELLQAQHAAAAEIGALVRRLDELKAPMQDRLRSYEDRIGELEKDLAERNAENRELLKLKIEMIRQQLETERARNRVDFN